nr:twin-arginine translocase TatA/TatE family subunit [Aeromonas fluvialis]
MVALFFAMIYLVTCTCLDFAQQSLRSILIQVPDIFLWVGARRGLCRVHVWHMLILLLVAVLVFGSKRLASAGEDLGTAIKDFRKAMRDDENHPK